MNATELLQWWNLIYLLPLVLSVVWLAGMMMGGGHPGHGAGHAVHGHAPGGTSHPASLGPSNGTAAHAPHPGTVHAGGTSQGPATSGSARPGAGQPAGGSGGRHSSTRERGVVQRAGHSASAGGMSRALTLLGLGRTPITLVLGTLFLCWGAIGLLVNRLLGVHQAPGVFAIGLSLAITAVFAGAATRMVAGVAGQIIPATETYAIRQEDLVGRLGTAVYAVTEFAGTIQVSDSYGALHRVMACTPPGAGAISAGSPVLVIARQPEDGRYVVEKPPLEAIPSLI